MRHLPNINTPQDLKNLSPEALVELAVEVRQELIAAVAQTGGHLASNLGSVELTIALHHVFDLPTDKVIWDVSHQTYTHKMFTGRKDRLNTLRQYGGLAGFSRRAESKYDDYGAGHASTSISAAMGFAAARDNAELDHKVIAVIGDGSMTGGLAFEGLNNAGSLKKDILVILNDNTWSISKNVGAISRYLTNVMTDEKVDKLRREIWDMTGRFKRRDKIRTAISKIESSIQTLLVPGMLFKNMGFRYFGPIDGHDLPLLVKTLHGLKGMSGPILLHIGTIKGKGYDPAEADALKYHGVTKFDKVTGEMAPKKPGRPAYTKVFGDSMVELGARDKRVIAITAAMATGTGLVGFSQEYPDRFFDVGIAEGHAGCFAAGLAAEGMRPYLTIYSTFLQRAYDQIIHDIALQELPVVLCMDRAGLAGNDGPTHHGNFDIPYLSTVPNTTIAVPKDGNELRAMLHKTLDLDFKGPIGIRYPRDTVPTDMTDEFEDIEWGKWEILTPMTDTVVLAVGTMVHSSLAAAEQLAEEGDEISVINARFLKPLDDELLTRIAKRARAIITVEEGSHRAGFGQAIADYLLTSGYQGVFKSIGIPDNFVQHGARELLLRDIGMDVDGLVRSFGDVIERSYQQKQGGILQKLKLKRNGSSRRRPRTVAAGNTSSIED